MRSERVGCSVGRGRWAARVVCAATANLVVLSFLPACAVAAFTRPFVRQITSVSEPRGIAVYKEVSGQEDDLWVSSGETLLEEFGPAYEGNGPIPHTPAVEPGAGSLAAERVSGRFYRGSGTGNPGFGWMAVDNSPSGSIEDPSACGPLPEECVHYATEDGERGGVVKRNAKEEAVPFTASEPYITGEDNNVITGIPEHPTGNPGGYEGVMVAVDSQGDIYTAGVDEKAVHEYAPSGAYIQTFDLEEESVPELGNGLGRGAMFGITVDPVSRHLLVAVRERALLPGGGEEYVGAIDEFDTRSGRFVAQITQGSEGKRLQQPVAMAADSRGDVYVADQGRGVVDVYGPGAYEPTVSVGEPSVRRSESVVLNGAVDPLSLENPEHAHLAACHFQYVTDATFESNVRTHGDSESEGFAELGTGGGEPECVPPPASIEPNDTAQPVHAEIKGLQPGVTYRYRLVANTEEGAKLGGTARTAALAFTAPAPATVLSSAAENVSSTFADLHAQIDPDGANTSYYFEYGPTTAYGQDAPALTATAATGESVGTGGPAGNATDSVVQHLGGLTAGTIYHFRVVATNSIEDEHKTTYGPQTTYGPDQTFTTLPAAVSSERGYELVTPVNKEGGSDMFAEPLSGRKEFVNIYNDGIAAESGEKFFLKTVSAFGGFPFAAEQGYVFHREPTKGGWSYTSLADPSLGVQEFTGGVVEAADLSRVAFGDAVGASLSEEGARLEALVGAPGGPYTNLHTDVPVFHDRFVEESGDTRFVGGSRELTTVVYESTGEPFAGESEACPGAVGESGSVLCESVYDSAPRLVNVDDADIPVSRCGAQLGSIREGSGKPEDGSAYRAVSADGSRVFFSAPSPAGQEGKEGCWNRAAEGKGASPENAPQLYARIKKAERSGEVAYATVKVSAPERKGVVEYPAFYAGASEDGTRVFFATKTQVTKEAVERKLHSQQLYECEIVEEGDEPECKLTRVSAGDPGYEASDPDVSLVYAVAADGTAVYFNASQALAPGAPATGGVYRYDIQSGVTSYVASTAGWEPSRYDSGACPDVGDVAPCSLANWYTTADGRYALFIGPTGQVDRFDGQAAEEGEPALTCVSCSGEGGEAGGEFARSAVEFPSDGPVQAISENGEYVFFDTPRALVTQATNDTLDTYEWHDGVIALIGSGSNPSPTYFLGYSPYYYYSESRKEEVKVEGGNVFIGTHAQLVPQDTDSLGDIYDARICEPESPCIKSPVGETRQCEGGSCQTPPGAAVFQTPATFTTTSSGNPTTSKPSPKHETKLEAALKACKKRTNKKKRASCERLARELYGPHKAKKTAKNKPAKGRR
jgi:hypothetical protein